MKRRTFLQSVLGFVVAPCLPIPLPTPNITKPIVKECKEMLNLGAFSQRTNVGWKMWQTARILNDTFVHIIECKT